MQGWIKLHRKIQQSAIWSDSCAVHLWIHLLLKANHDDGEVFMNSNVIKVKRGQLLTGRKKLSAETGINESKIQRLLKTFEKCHMIEQQTNSVNRLISILNYDSHQVGEQQVNNKRTANEHKQECKELKKDTIEAFSMPDDKYAKACKWFYDELLKLDKIKKSQNWQTKTWYDSFRLLEKSDEVDWESEFKPVMKYYVKCIGKEYCPEAYSPKTVRTKWIKLRDYMNRNNKGSDDDNPFKEMLK